MMNKKTKFITVLCILLLLSTVAMGYGWVLGNTIATNDESHINLWHDSQRNVTCWIYTAYAGSYSGSVYGGISCLPDYQLNMPVDYNFNNTITIVINQTNLSSDNKSRIVIK